MHTLHILNLTLTLVFSLCCAYQLLYLVLPLVKKEKPLPPSAREHDFAVLICARNEEKVVGGLLDSLRRQTYPAEKLHVFVLADNCTGCGRTIPGASTAILSSTRTTGWKRTTSSRWTAASPPGWRSSPATATA